jgi:hypothetical protein
MRRRRSDASIRDDLLRNAEQSTAAQERKRPPRERTEAKTQFAIIFGDRFTL